MMVDLEKRSLVIQGIIACTAIIGVILAGYAFKEYKKMNIAYRDANTLSTIQTLDSWEMKFLNMVYEDDVMNSFWVSIDNVAVKECADRQLKLLLKKKDTNFKYVWRHASDLDHILFEEKDFYDHDKIILRKYYNAIERLLYLLSAVYSAKTYNMIDDSYWDSYKPYIYGVGAHPLFLCVVSYGHDYGFYNKVFAQEIRRIYMSNEKLKAVIGELYPDMLKENWVEKTGANSK